MNTDKVLKFKSSDLPRQAGEMGRIRVLKGAEMPVTYILKSNSIVFGRGDESDLIVSDSKVSRSHSRLEYTKDGWLMTDLGSANGIFFQGEYIRKFALKSGEHFTMGDTILEFLGSHEESRLLSSLPKHAEDIARQDVALAEQKLRVQNLAKGAKIAKNPGKKQANPLVLVLLIAGGLGYLFMDDLMPLLGGKPAAKTQKKSNEAANEDRSLASYLPAGVSAEVEKTADQYYWQGFREYMKGNYLRAKDNFDLALQVNPGHEKARHYLGSATKDNEDEIKHLIDAARKAKRVGRLQDARGNCETALRHMYNDRANPNYADCDEIIKELNERSAQ